MFNDADIIRGGMSLVPDLRQQLIQDALFKQQQTVFNQGQEDRAAAQRAAAKAAQEEAAFRAALDDAMLTGDPRAIQRLRFRFPEFTKGMKDAFDALDEDVRRTNLTQIGSVYARGNAGDFEGAASILRQRVEADRAAGETDPTDEEVLAGLESDDPVKQRAALALVGIQLAAVNEDKFAEVYGKLNPAESKPAIQREVEYYRSIGRDDLADQLLTNNADPLVQITGPAGTSVIPRSQALGGIPQQQGGGDPASSGGGAPVSTGAPSGVRGPALGKAIEDTALSVVPGVRVTSRQRSPAKNKAVGGAANSFHLSGEARDFVPPAGVSMGQLASRLKSAMPGFDVIDEGDHVHVEPSSRRAAGPVRVRSVQEANKLKPGTRYLTPDGREFVR